MSGIEVLFPGNDGSGVCLLRSARGSRERTQESELLQGLSPLTLGTEGLASATPLHSQQDLETGRDALSFPICPFSEKAMAPHSSTLAWQIPWMEEPGRLQSMGSHRVRHD